MAIDLKARVLEASVQLISEQGLGGLSLREVARRAGVSHQAPYHYFEDKAAIVAALVEEGFHRLTERMMEASLRNGTATQRLVQAGRAYVTFALEEPVYFRLMFRPELTDLKRFPAVEFAGDRALAVLQQLVDEKVGAHTGQVKKEVIVSMHWSLVHGLATLLIDGPLGEKFPNAQTRNRHVEQVLKEFAESG